MMPPETMAVSSVYEGRDALVCGESVLGILKRPAFTSHRGESQKTILLAAGCWNRPVSRGTAGCFRKVVARKPDL